MSDNNRKSRSNVIELFAKPNTDGEEHPIIGHFFNYFEPIVAASDEQKDESFKLRYQVYCSELGYEKAKRNGQEVDAYDEYSHSLLIKHLPTDKNAGTIRIIQPSDSKQLLPIEHHYGKGLDQLDIPCGELKRNEICEMSRIAISSLFRRRAVDRHKGSETGAINQDTYSEVEVRCFPLLAVGLYLSAAALCRVKGIKHAYAMMEPELARSAQYIGVQCKQIGSYIDFHGNRAPFYINPNSLISLSPAFLALITAIEEQLRLN
jgi:N-acyl amino acid synthase of PEP-CTERM/exosortase system